LAGGELVTNWFHPGLIYILGALLIPLFKGKSRNLYLLLLPILAFLNLLFTSKGLLISAGKTWVFPFLGYELILGRIDKLSLVFAYIFVIASLCMIIYSLHIKESGQHVASHIYVGSTLGVVFAGDLLTLFFFWEMMAWSALYLIWYRKTKASYRAGFRYILVHVFGGLFLLGGILIHLHETGSLAFEIFPWGETSSQFHLGSILILLSFLINAAVPPLHAWLPDAYPEATVTGAVYLTAFTTKSAIYTLIRGFPGLEILIWLGAIMAVYGVVFAVLENDIRRLLAYHIISQVGYMVCGVGMGTIGTVAGKLAINGAVAHAFCHILYKALLFMGAGAVLEVTGRSKLSELGGIYKYMPITFHLYMIGAYSISGFPLFNGFISKTMIIQASAMSHMPIIWIMLEGASIGTFLHTGLKLPWGTWFSREKPICNAKEPPLNMLIGMGITAFLCILLGVYPKLLYEQLPYSFNYEPYTISHIVSVSQLLGFTFIGFWILRKKLYGEPMITLDTDWFYRIFLHWVLWFCEKPLMAFASYMDQKVMEVVHFFVWMSRNPALALRIKREEMTLKMKSLFANPSHLKEGELRLVEKKRNYPGELPKLGLGGSLFLILLALSLYLILYLISLE
jgi:multicomponent Na+:H+ antiporter subunit D